MFGRNRNRRNEDREAERARMFELLGLDQIKADVRGLTARADQTDERFNHQAATVHYTVAKVDDLFVATATEYRWATASTFGHTVTLAETQGASKASAVRKLKAQLTPRVQPLFVEDKPPVAKQINTHDSAGWRV